MLFKIIFNISFKSVQVKQNLPKMFLNQTKTIFKINSQALKINNENKKIKQNVYNSVMRSVKNKKQFQHQKLKTLCTLDTSDIIIGKDFRQTLNKRKPLLSTQKPKSNTRSKSLIKTNTQQLPRSKQKIQCTSHKRQNTTINHNRTINTDTKSKKSSFKSKQRIKTQYTQSSPNKIVLNNLQIFTTVKNYNVDPFYIVNTIKSNKQETIHTVKYLDRNKKSVFYLMKKSNNPKTIEKYQKEITVKQQLTDLFKPNQRKNFSCIYKVYKKDKQENMYLVYYLEGQSLSWKKTLSTKLIHNLIKNNMEILKHLIVQISKAIHILSIYGFYHSQIRLKNILVQLKQDQENVKVSKVVKLGNLSKCMKVKDKKSLQSMPHSHYTPPQILNYIMFQKEHKNFNRSWLQYIYKYEDGWRICVWSLGILILQLLNQQPFPNTFMDVLQIIQFQKQIISKSSYIFDKLQDQQLSKLIKRMLSINPYQRPSPQNIIIALTS